MPVGRDVEPVILPRRTLRKHTECRVPNRVFVGINKDEQLRRHADLSQFAEMIVLMAIDAVAHVIATIAIFLWVIFQFRLVGWTTIDAGILVVPKKQRGLLVDGVI